MKKTILIALIVLVGGALLIVPLLRDDTPGGGVDTEIRPTPAVFDFKGDPGTFAGKESTLKIKLREKDLKKVEVIYLDKVLQSWDNPKADLTFTFTPDRVGTSSIKVVSTANDGKAFTDSRHIRVLSDITPERLEAKIITMLNHDLNNYTQGLEFYNGKLFEGTGQYGKSKVLQINVGSGDLEGGIIIGLDGNYFGEGITILDGTVYQLTWREGRCFTYALGDDSIQLDGEFEFTGQEGWGLCNDGTSLIMSDGTERITFRSPQSFQIERTIDVYNDRGPMIQLNELEYIDGKIYANVYQTNLVVSIDPETGKILEEIDCSALEVDGRGTGDVLNGIAYNDENGKIYMTGKYWMKMFEVEFVKL